MKPIAIYKSGSSLFLDNPHDIDYLYFYRTREERLEALKKYRKQGNIDIHFRTPDMVNKCYIYAYVYQLMEKIEGEDIEIAYDIFDHQEEYKALLKRYAERTPKTHKYWYHIYIGVCMLKKGKRTLTKAEKKTAQNIHDKGINDEQFKTIIDYLE